MDMTEQFDQDQFTRWFMIASLAGVEIEGAVKECPRMVTMQLNDVEINPEAAIKRLEEEFDRQVDKRARAMLEEMKNDILSPFEDKVRELTDAVGSLIKEKLGRQLE
jgi:hypothetical protein